MEDQKCHVMVLADPVQGHINPLLQFAKHLVSKGLTATFVTTPYAATSVTEPTVAIHSFSDGFDEGGINEAPSEEAYFESYRTVGSKTLTQLITKLNDSGSPVTCIIYDFLMPWVLDVAEGFGIYSAVFFTFSASICSMFWQVTNGGLSLPVKQSGELVHLPGIPPLRFSELPSLLARSTSGCVHWKIFLETFGGLRRNDWVFCNSFEDLEIEVVKAMEGVWPLVTIGPMVPSAYLPQPHDHRHDHDTTYGANLWKPTSHHSLKWLDTQPPNSVIYISFGSVAKISNAQAHELAWGLKSSDKTFMWVIKESESTLPIEFLNEIHEMGIVVTWCNQLEVLAHQAVGCFVTHCGWNSTLEAMSLGVPMVCIAQGRDQQTNAKFVEEVWKVGVRAKEGKGGVVRREEVEICVREVTDGEKREEFRKNASKWRELAKRALSVGGSSDITINKFIAKLMEGKKLV